MKRLSIKHVFFAIIFSVLVVSNCFAHGSGVHSEQLVYVLFGYQSAAELNQKANLQTKQAYELIRRAIAVAIDETNKGGKHSDDYTYLRNNLAGQVRIPAPSAFRITNRFHRQVCHQGFDYKYNNQASQARWQTGRQLLIDVVSKAFGTPRPLNPAVADFIAMISYYTHLIGDLSRSTNNNIEHQSIEFVTHTIRPWCVRIEKALNNCLLSDIERKKYSIEFMIDGLLRGYTLTRQQANQIKFNNGILTRNEWRRQENLNEVEDNHGNEYFVSQQVRPIESIYQNNNGDIKDE